MKRCCLYRIKTIAFHSLFQNVETKTGKTVPPPCRYRGKNKLVLSPAEHKVAKKRQEKEQILS